ncbi:MAG TPA: TetR family transcriptional regulator [Solirubrobacteraceae bacterium]|nr:TetR family transcriptional regulator [Solirubrobacteraceae bacterium]
MRILGAMVEVSAERGSANVTVAHIVERAGVSRRTFYELFTDREDCFLGAFDEGVARVSRYVLAAYDPDARWVERIRSGLMALLCFLDGEPDTGRLLIVGSLGAGARALERRGRVFAQLVAVVDEGRAVSKHGAGLPPLTAEGIVGGVLSVLHSRLLSGVPSYAKASRNGASASSAPEGSPAGDADGDRLSPGPGLLALTGPLMGMIVLPYLGRAASRRENAIPIPIDAPLSHHPQGNPLGQLEMRLTYRTVRVLMAIAAHPGSSNRTVADAAEVSDQGQMSKLLARLEGLDLIANNGGGATRGEPNAWTLTDKGRHIQQAIAKETSAA